MIDKINKKSFGVNIRVTHSSGNTIYLIRKYYTARNVFTGVQTIQVRPLPYCYYLLLLSDLLSYCQLQYINVTVNRTNFGTTAFF